MSILFVFLGFAALIFGANWLVDGASSLAKKYNVSDLVIGLTIVAFGTSAPELVVNSIASAQGYSDIVLGNVIGSNNFNLFIILGIAGLIYPIKVQSSTAWKEIPLSLLASVLVILFANNYFIGSDNLLISRLDGILLLLTFAAFLYYVFWQMRKEQSNTLDTSKPEITSNLKIWGFIIIGLAGLILGGQLVVDNSVKIASLIGVSEKIIGLTIVAAGTSLPELVTSVVAALKRNSDIAIGNVIGSNIFNLLLILSVSSFINPISFKPNFNLDLVVLISGTVFLLLAMFTGIRKKLDRWEAAILLVLYLSYLFYLIKN
ncbi:calcium/sodium antiporter [Carboxylicivirga caseinilyticus]|uniref:calcium/sodium antiporter n=1 Tax=Carboxylicivirga caseinilyticus TaxID=3417572 RepID=UPI003D3377BD